MTEDEFRSVSLKWMVRSFWVGLLGLVVALLAYLAPIEHDDGTDLGGTETTNTYDPGAEGEDGAPDQNSDADPGMLASLGSIIFKTGLSFGGAIGHAASVLGVMLLVFVAVMIPLVSVRVLNYRALDRICKRALMGMTVMCAAVAAIANGDGAWSAAFTSVISIPISAVLTSVVILFLLWLDTEIDPFEKIQNDLGEIILKIAPKSGAVQDAVMGVSTANQESLTQHIAGMDTLLYHEIQIEIEKLHRHMMANSHHYLKYRRHHETYNRAMAVVVRLRGLFSASKGPIWQSRPFFDGEVVDPEPG